jgi:hypothetical protein
MTNAQVKTATDAVLCELIRNTGGDPGDMMVILGTAISAVARGSSDPVASARVMINGLEGWIRLYRSEQRARAGAES